MNKPAVIALTSVLAAGIVTGAFYWYGGNSGNAFDQRLNSALQAVQGARTYEAAVETSTAFSDRFIEVSGVYRLDFEAKRFGSYATTTLTIPRNKKDERTHRFTLSNLSIGSDIFVKITTDSSLLQKTILHSPEWYRFRADAIPSQFKDIAVFGPVLDNLALLADNGAYLALSGGPVERRSGDETLYVYTFKLSSKAGSVSGGTLEPLMRRIASGDIQLWIDERSQVRMMTFSGDNYSSTTTVLSVNSPVDITAPAAGQ